MKRDLLLEYYSEIMFAVETEIESYYSGPDHSYCQRQGEYNGCWWMIFRYCANIEKQYLLRKLLFYIGFHNTKPYIDCEMLSDN